MQNSMEQMYQEALNPQLYPDSRLLAVMQGHDTSIPMAVAMAAQQQRTQLQQAAQGQQAMQQAKQPSVKDQMVQSDMAKKQEAMQAYAQQMPQGLPQQVAQQPQGLMQQEGREGLDQLPSGQLQNLAGGGIIAFAGGDMISGNWDDDEDQQARADAQEDSYLKSMLSRAGQGVQHFGSQVMDTLGLPHGQQATQAQPTSLRDMAAAAAQKYGVPESLVMHVMGKETGGMKDPVNAVSKAGAQGVMQLMPKTAQQLGVTNAFDPAQNIEGGVKYLAQLHQKYQDPRLAAMAYNWGPGNVDKWQKHGQKASAVPKETRNYVADANFAEGGNVRHFKTGDYTGFGEENPYDPNEPSIADTFGRVLGSPLERLKNSISGLGFNTNADVTAQVANTAQPKPVAAPAQQPVQQPVQQAPVAPPQTPAAPPQAPMAPTQGAAPSLDEYYNRSQSRIDDTLEELKKQRKDASGLGLLTAGLGMLDKSPFAGENIKKGALAGISQYGQDVKGIGALQNQVLGAQAALDKNRISAAIQQQNKQTGLEEKQNLAYTRQLADYDKLIDSEIANKNKTGITPMTPEMETRYRLQRRLELVKNSPKLYDWYDKQGGITTAPSNILATIPTGGAGAPVIRPSN